MPCVSIAALQDLTPNLQICKVSGRITNRDGEWRLASSEPFTDRAGEDMPLTDKVKGTVASRLDSLVPENELAVKAASVLGERFDAALLQRLLPDLQNPDGLDAVLDHLVRDQLIRATGESGSYAFCHTLIREAAYTQLTPSQTRAVHRSAADGIEVLHAGHLPPHYAALAHHWSKADVPVSTVRYAELAASQALASGAYLEADRLLRVCLELTERTHRVPCETPRLIHWHVALAEAGEGLGRVEERGIEAREALALAGRPQPRRPVEPRRYPCGKGLCARHAPPGVHQRPHACGRLGARPSPQRGGLFLRQRPGRHDV